MNLTDLLSSHEGKGLEFKRDLSSPDGILRTIIAFANTSGGILLIGVDDATAHVRGLADPLDAEQRLVSMVSDAITPRVLPEIEILPWRRTHVLGVQVFPSGARPHYLKRSSREQSVYVRVGSSNRRADHELIAELQRFARGEAFDEQPMPDLTADTIDFPAVAASFAAVRKLKRTDMQTLRLVTQHQARRVPTIGGVLLYGRDRAHLFPDAWIQAGRFAGIDRSHIVDSLAIRADLPRAIELAIDFVQKHDRRAAEIGAVRRRDRWGIPPIALREAIINSVAHADYSQRGAPIRVSMFDDRLEIENPGLLPFGLVIEDVLRGISKLRNRVIGRVFHELGLIEQWGSGVQRMTAACIEAGLPPPALEEIGTRFRVTIHTHAKRKPVLDATDQSILDSFTGTQGLATQEIAKRIGRSPRATRTRLLGLVGRGLVREIGSSPQDPRRRYFRVR